MIAEIINPKYLFFNFNVEYIKSEIEKNNKVSFPIPTDQKCMLGSKKIYGKTGNPNILNCFNTDKSGMKWCNDLASKINDQKPKKEKINIPVKNERLKRLLGK